jgi:hypothetical protein
MTKAQAREQERQEAITQLREMVKPGDTLYTICRHVSRSGMSRRISVYTKDHQMIDYLVAQATGFSLAKHEGLSVGGCGMDMGFHVVESLSSVLYGGYGRSETSQGYKCLGKDGNCPSNYHVNYRYHKDDGPQRWDLLHTDGYAIRQRWL